MAMLLLLRHPIRRYRFGNPPKRVSYRYRLLDLLTSRVTAATYKGVPKNSYSYRYDMHLAHLDGWQVHKPQIGLPDGA